MSANESYEVCRPSCVLVEAGVRTRVAGPWGGRGRGWRRRTPPRVWCPGVSFSCMLHVAGMPLHAHKQLRMLSGGWSVLSSMAWTVVNWWLVARDVPQVVSEAIASAAHQCHTACRWCWTRIYPGAGVRLAAHGGYGHGPRQALHAADGLALHPGRDRLPAAEACQRAVTHVGRAEPWCGLDAQVRYTLRGCDLAGRVARSTAVAAMQFVVAPLALFLGHRLQVYNGHANILCCGQVMLVTECTE